MLAEILPDVLVAFFTALATVAVSLFVYARTRDASARARTDAYTVEVFRVQVQLYLALVDALIALESAANTSVVAQARLAGLDAGPEQGHWLGVLEHSNNDAHAWSHEVSRLAQRAAYVLGDEVPQQAEAFQRALTDYARYPGAESREAYVGHRNRFLAAVRGILSVDTVEKAARRLIDEDRAVIGERARE